MSFRVASLLMKQVFSFQFSFLALAAFAANDDKVPNVHPSIWHANAIACHSSYLLALIFPEVLGQTVGKARLRARKVQHVVSVIHRLTQIASGSYVGNIPRPTTTSSKQYCA